ncbi:unnamed protein product [Aspergillus oryzae RIB40]|uniref:DNA, SC023 n=1 Tax=Aspergillus oryzae (strain ATCC 42149 / RIB 40) TaxID=510516 RepID=Q2UHV5_ASPOR|nr:unnamed protein product [Aspergillus oryzae RIB40]BAE58860.1 unnamed protein product [Aspergillus oryzae RIB40]
MHVPTLNNHGVKFDSLPPGGATLTDNLDNVWSKVHHSLLQNHVGFLLVALGLENHGGWAITLETLSTVLGGGQDSPGAKLLEYFTKDTMPFKCFLRMRMESKYRDDCQNQELTFPYITVHREGSAECDTHELSAVEVYNRDLSALVARDLTKPFLLSEESSVHTQVIPRLPVLI